MAERLSELGIMIVFGYTLWLIVSLGPTLEGFFAQTGGDAAGNRWIKRRQCFGLRHRSAMGQAVRLHGEHGLRLAVRLSDDCYRSVAVWAKGIVKAHPRGHDTSGGCRPL